MGLFLPFYINEHNKKSLFNFLLKKALVFHYIDLFFLAGRLNRLVFNHITNIM